MTTLHETALLQPICALCHTLDKTISAESLAAGATWSCTRCGHTWSTARLETAAAYAEYTASR